MTSGKRGLLAAAVLALPLFAAGCGESTSVTVYEKGKYQGKPDTQPWAGAQFKGDRVAWENAVKARTENQNEYARIVAQ